MVARGPTGGDGRCWTARKTDEERMAAQNSRRLPPQDRYIGTSPPLGYPAASTDGRNGVPPLLYSVGYTFLSQRWIS